MPYVQKTATGLLMTQGVSFSANFWVDIVHEISSKNCHKSQASSGLIETLVLSTYIHPSVCLKVNSKILVKTGQWTDVSTSSDNSAIFYWKSYINICQDNSAHNAILQHNEVKIDFSA